MQFKGPMGVAVLHEEYNHSHNTGDRGEGESEGDIIIIADCEPSNTNM